MKAFLTASLIALTASGAAIAGSDWRPYGVYGSAGTEGLGLGLTFAGRPSWNMRAEINSLSTNRDLDVDNTTYKLDIRHISQSLLYDYRPYEGSFRLTTGIGINQSKLDFSGRVFNTAPTPGFPSSSADVRGRIELPPVMPYVGLGLGLGKTRSGIGFYADLGAYIGSPKLKSFETPQGYDSTQDRRNLEEELRSIKVYPVGKIGINYQF